MKTGLVFLKFVKTNKTNMQGETSVSVRCFPLQSGKNRGVREKRVAPQFCEHVTRYELMICRCFLVCWTEQMFFFKH